MGAGSGVEVAFPPPNVRRLSVDATGEVDEARRSADALRREFPTVEVVVAARPASRARSPHALDVAEWRDPAADLLALDARVDAACTDTIALASGGAPWRRAAVELLTRHQWRLSRRNAASSTPLFDRILERHRALHDLAKPLVRADYVHALDTWQWMLRLAPRASTAAQLAALFHDVERLSSEPDERVEHRARDYRAFKIAHAREGARIVREALERAGSPPSVVERTSALVSRHEETGADPELALLNDADALSFFSRNSDGFLRYFGLDHTRAKVRYTLGRMRPAAHARLGQMRLVPDVRGLVVESRGGSRATAGGGR